MKRLKLLPSVLMLVLCVGVLCMGIYAASPNSNQITGSITINAANPEVSYKAYLGNNFNEDTLIGEASGRQNAQLALDSENLVLDLSSASSTEDVNPIEIWLEVTNKSTTESLGAYFATGALNEQADYEDILRTQPIYEDPEAQEKNTVANVNLPFYHELPKATVEGGETTYYPVYMRLTITPATMVESRLVNLEFTLNLNIESYVASTDMTGEWFKMSLSGSYYPEELETLKTSCKGIVIPGEKGSTDMYAFGVAGENSIITDITIAPGITDIVGSSLPIKGCKEIVWPYTATSIDASPFIGASNPNLKIYITLNNGYTSTPTISNFVIYGKQDGISYEDNVLKITKEEYLTSPSVSVFGRNLYIGGEVEEIPAEAFKDRENIETIYIASTVTTVGTNAIEGCSMSLKIYCNTVGGGWSGVTQEYTDPVQNYPMHYTPITGVTSYEAYLALINA